MASPHRLRRSGAAQEGIRGDLTKTFDHRRIEQIKDARQILSRRQLPTNEGRVVAELSLGFWRFLLAKRYQNTLWAPHLRHAFPGMKPQRRGDVYCHVDVLHTLRNRIAHHEPIHHFPLDDRHDRMLLVIEWIDPAMSDWLSGLSRVPELLKQRPNVGSASGDCSAGISM
ncbi:hypothetical protein SAMN05421595_2841 [Austwickia chelonae]|uniref:hypothetical protein n=1 Tax=Austwickia chelonae TaxID=100225 RepID=UPI00068E1F52|nr:hypothetical protein [Austwickia chelonae]SEW40813.1 hypothetical protein SAMN05421595_2841 [Austwickia chelonae]